MTNSTYFLTWSNAYLLGLYSLHIYFQVLVHSSKNHVNKQIQGTDSELLVMHPNNFFIHNWKWGN